MGDALKLLLETLASIERQLATCTELLRATRHSIAGLSYYRDDAQEILTRAEQSEHRDRRL